MACILDGATLTLTGNVGDFWSEDSFTYGEVVLALAGIDDTEKLAVRINSGGGIAPEGAAIHALLSRRSGVTEVVVDGVAASAASLIAMAGDTVTMSTGSVLMIHDPAVFTMGNSTEHAKSIEALEAMATSYARVYAAKCGKSEEESRDIMKAEHWYTPAEAIAEGFADAVDDGSKASPVAAFDYRQYSHAPQRLVALAKRKNWTFATRDHAPPTASAPASNRQSQETDAMTEKERADQLAAELEEQKATAKATADELAKMKAGAADRERSDAILALDEAKGREQQAAVLAKTAGMTSETAKEILAAFPLSPTDREEEEDNPKTYERRRLDGAGMRDGKSPSAKGDRSILAAAVARTNKRR